MALEFNTSHYFARNIIFYAKLIGLRHNLKNRGQTMTYSCERPLLFLCKTGNYSKLTNCIYFGSCFAQTQLDLTCFAHLNFLSNVLWNGSKSKAIEVRKHYLVSTPVAAQIISGNRRQSQTWRNYTFTKIPGVQCSLADLPLTNFRPRFYIF